MTKRLVPVVLAAVLVNLLGLPSAVAAATHPPRIESLSLLPTSLPAAGGAVHLAAKTKYATKCEITATPHLAGLPKHVACGHGTVKARIRIPADKSASPMSYRVTLTAKGAQHRVVSSRTVVVANGALAWSKRSNIETPQGAPVSLSCPTVAFCADGDFDGDLQTFRNGAWQRPANVWSLPIGAVSCVSASFCVAASVFAYSTAWLWNGTSWVDGYDNDIGPGGDPAESTAAISCTSTTFCMEVDGFGDAVQYDGDLDSGFSGAWMTPVDVDGDTPLTSVSCTSTTFCIAVDDAGNALKWNGTDWSAATAIDNGADLLSVSCTSSSFCAAVDGGGNALTFDGAVWSAPQATGDNGTTICSSGSCPLGTVSCVTATFCVAGGVGDLVTFNGTDWSDPSAFFPSALSCATTTSCTAVAQDGTSVTYDGADWSTPTRIDPANYLTDGSCATPRSCVAVNGAGEAVRYTKSGWKHPVQIDGFADLAAVSCATATFCVAVDQTGDEVTLRGSTWSDPVSIDDGNPLTSVSCPTTTFCMATDAVGNAVRYNGSTWSSPVLLADDPEVVTCVSARFCLAMRSDGVEYSTYNGKVWTDGDSTGFAPATYKPYSVSIGCDSATFCIAAEPGGLSRFDGKTWHAPITPSASAVSCRTATACVSVGADRSEIYTSKTWAVTPAHPIGDPIAVSCPASNFCVALDVLGASVAH